MRFVFPTAEYEPAAAEFIEEFYAYGSDINGVGGLHSFLRESTYTDWLANVIRFLDIANPPEGMVPGYTYFYVDDSNTIVGMINIRLALNDFLREQGGHIGYCVRPSQRKKGIGTAMLREALEFLAPIGLRNVLITCSKENIASAKVVRNCGGVLLDECFSEALGAVIQKYEICNGV